jgi:hypothetical protein
VSPASVGLGKCRKLTRSGRSVRKRMIAAVAAPVFVTRRTSMPRVRRISALLESEVQPTFAAVRTDPLLTRHLEA